MIKEYCDICGKEKKTEKYVLPELGLKYIEDKTGARLMAYNALNPMKKDICSDCARAIFRFIKGYTFYMVHGETVTIDINDDSRATIWDKKTKIIKYRKDENL